MAVSELLSVYRESLASERQSRYAEMQLALTALQFEAEKSFREEGRQRENALFALAEAKKTTSEAKALDSITVYQKLLSIEQVSDYLDDDLKITKPEKVVNKLVAYEKCKRVVIYTNAKIIPKGENLACLKNKKVSLDITNYGESSSAHSRLVELIKKENITFCTFRCTTWLDSGRIMPFSNKNDKELEKQFNNCQQRDLVSLLHGKLYRCPFSANGVNLKAIPQNDSDEVNLIDDNLGISELREQIRKLYYDKKYLTACLYCNGKAQNETLKIPSAIQTKKPLTYEISAK